MAKKYHAGKIQEDECESSFCLNSACFKCEVEGGYLLLERWKILKTATTLMQGDEACIPVSVVVKRLKVQSGFAKVSGKGWL